ncbi:MAG: deoxyguanosinetriphosphate triphosphohydrolase [Spirochaetes bacterium RBG_13_51_14]|nr:MAG: deoxyguanosinetriphosphate triphosphohydrolase [Spirochaetes bacterium RBG_13_51_14]
MIRVDRTYLQEIEEKSLAPYAARSASTRGRRFNEKPHPYRTEFQRDRERIIHSRAFRRLEYKTQVFINHEGDHYRTRLTHTIEVAQISRGIARALRLNEDLAESVALAHDLGHTPFGHAGERELNDLLKGQGGFEHNRQSLRVVDKLEKRYPDFDGLNLTWETREGIIKHSSAHDHPEYRDFSPETQPSLEAQIIDLADEIAYNNHDLDDGLSSGILADDDVKKLALWTMGEKRYNRKDGGNPKIRHQGIIRSIIDLLVSDLVENTMTRLDRFSVNNYSEVLTADEKMAAFSPETEAANIELKSFLMDNLYQHYRVARMTIKAQKVIRDLFEIYTRHPDTLPEDYQKKFPNDGIVLTATDYIAGMTDRFALEEHQKLTDPMIRV